MRCYRHPDRETYISCSECGRPICTECMTPAPVGQRCPEHSGRRQGVARMRTGIRRVGDGRPGIVTRTLIAINVLVYLAELLQGAGVNANSGSIYANGVLVASARALLVTPMSPTVGASGAIFGVLGAALILERQGSYVLGGSALGLIVINLIFSFTLSNISIGGHIGGLIGGALFMLAFSPFRPGPPAPRRLGGVGGAGGV